MANTFKRTLELSKRIMLRTVAGQAFHVDFDALPDTVLAKVLEVGARTVLTNVWNGGGKDATETERLAAVQKKLDAWKKGEFNVVERGESQYTAFREVFIADCITAGMTTKSAEDAMKAKVADKLGKDAKATFANFIEASAIEYAEGGEMTRDEARERLESYYATEADRRAKERAEVKVELPTIDLAKFAKPAA